MRLPGGRWRRRAMGGGRHASLRWEVGAPLVVVGTILAGLMLGMRGGGVLFWAGAVLAGVGLALFVDRP